MATTSRSFGLAAAISRASASVRSAIALSSKKILTCLSPLIDLILRVALYPPKQQILPARRERRREATPVGPGTGPAHAGRVRSSALRAVQT